MVRSVLGNAVRAAVDGATRLDDRVGVGTVIGLGAGGVLVQAVHATVATSVRSVVVGIVPPLLISLAVVAGGIWLARSEVREHALRVGGWCLLLSVFFVALQVLYISYQESSGGTIVQPVFDIAGSMTIGAMLGLLIGIHDASRERARRRVERGRERIADLNQRLRVLNRVLRHDIRNDVNVIEAQARDLEAVETETAVEGPPPVRTIRRKSEEILRRSERAREVERILDTENVATETVDVAETLANEIEKLRRTHPEATVEAELPRTAPVRSIPLLDSAIRNVLENAVEHNDGSPTVWVTLEEDEDGVEIRVADDGPGIPGREVEVIERGEETPVEHASGLGLWLVNWIVEESGGELAFEPNEPRGSVVVMRLRTAAEPLPRSEA